MNQENIKNKNFISIISIILGVISLITFSFAQIIPIIFAIFSIIFAIIGFKKSSKKLSIIGLIFSIIVIIRIFFSIPMGYIKFGNDICQGHPTVLGCGNSLNIRYKCDMCGKYATRPDYTHYIICFDCATLSNRCSNCGKIRTEYSKLQDNIVSVYIAWELYPLYDNDIYTGNQIKNYISQIQNFNNSIENKNFIITDILVNGVPYSSSTQIDTSSKYYIEIEKNADCYIKKVNFVSK